MKRYMLFDVGGTGVKYTTVDKNGEMVFPTKSFLSPSQKSAEEVFTSFKDVIETDKDIIGVGMAWPGPFDYKNGISLMDGLGKYQSIYGLDVAKGIKYALGRDDLEFKYDHDVAAFLSGYVHDEWLCDRRVIALVMGTGAGSAFSVNGRIVGSEEDGVPENGWIYNVPFRDVFIEDWLSSKGIEKLSMMYFGKALEGKILYDMAESGDETALKLWHEFGKIVKEGMMQFVSAFKPTDIVFGGMISKAWKYFGKAIEDDFASLGVLVHIANESSKYVFTGLYRLFGVEK